jgi:hypothetical protein
MRIQIKWEEINVEGVIGWIFYQNQNGRNKE